MKFFLTTFFLIYSLSLGCTDRDIKSPPTQQLSYFPLDVGNRWTYQLEGNSNFVWSFEVVGVTTIDSRKYKIMQRTYNPAFTDSAFFRQEGESKIFINWQGEDVLYIDFSRPVGSQWDTFGEFIGAITQILLKKETPSGTYKNGIEVLFDYPQAIDDEHWQVYAPQVGLVEMTGQIGRMQLTSVVLK